MFESYDTSNYVFFMYVFLQADFLFHIDQTAISNKKIIVGSYICFGPNTSCGNDLRYPKINAKKKHPNHVKSNDGICLLFYRNKHLNANDLKPCFFVWEICLP